MKKRNNAIKLSIIMFILLLSFPVTANAGIICNDGWESSCVVSGPGCCSHHGGVAGNTTSSSNYDHYSYNEDGDENTTSSANYNNYSNNENSIPNNSEDDDYSGICAIIIIIVLVLAGIFSENKS